MSDIDSDQQSSNPNVPVKLPYQVTFCSSHDDKFPPSHLEASLAAASSTSLHGWHSARNCSWPQTLILSFGCLCQLSKMQILSHQSKIAQSIELWAGKPNQSAVVATTKLNTAKPSNDVQWMRLGYFSLDSNVSSDYKARELKSVPINASCNQFKLVIKGAYSNPLNLYNQCAIVAINLVGIRLGPVHPSFIQHQASQLVPGLPNFNAINPISQPLSQLSPRHAPPADLDLTTTQYLLHLMQLKQQAIDAEDYDEAKRMKLKIDRLNAVIPEIIESEKRKREAIEQDDFDLAKQCKLHVERLREGALLGKPVAPAGLINNDIPIKRNRKVIDDVPSNSQMQSSNQTVQPTTSVYDEDRPIKPAKAAAAGSFDEQPLPTQKSNRSPPLNDDDDSFTVKHSTPSPVHDEDRPLKPAKSLPSFSEADGYPPSARDMSFKDRPINQPNKSKRASKSVIDKDERALPPSHSSYDFNDVEGAAPAVSTELPSAEPIASNQRKEADPIAEVFGLDLTQQLFSRHWQLRIESTNTIMAALTTVDDPLNEFALGVRIAGVGNVLLRVLTDKVTQVFVAGARLLELCMKELAPHAATGAGKEELRHALDAIARAMIDKLSSSSARERDGATQIITFIALHQHTPNHLIPTLLMAPLKPKDINNPTPIRARALLLAVLIAHFGVNESSSVMSTNSLMKWCIPHLTHKDAGVRDALLNVIGVISQFVDRTKLDSHIKSLPRAIFDTLDSKLTDVEQGILTFPPSEPPAHSYVDRPPPSNILPVLTSPSVSNNKSRIHHRHGSVDDMPLSARGPATDRKTARQSEPPLSARGNRNNNLDAPHSARKHHTDVLLSHRNESSRPNTGSRPQTGATNQPTRPRTASRPGTSTRQPEPIRSIPIPATMPENDDDHYDDDIDALNQGSPSQFRLNHANELTDNEVPGDIEHDIDIPDDSHLDAIPQCQFCGLADPSFTDDTLDIHYWQVCPMLLSCPHCEQVVEISSFTEHQLTECEAPDLQCVRCESCLEAVREDDWDRHEHDGCRRVSDGDASCPFCHMVIIDSEDGWKHHILDNGGCPENPRSMNLHE